MNESLLPQSELELVQKLSREAGAFDAVICSHWAHGGVYNFMPSPMQQVCGKTAHIALIPINSQIICTTS